MTVIMIFVSNAKVSIVGAEEATPLSCRYIPNGKDDDSLFMIELNEIALIGAGGGWTIEIYNQWYNNIGTSLAYTINYSSLVFNFFVYMQGTRNW